MSHTMLKAVRFTLALALVLCFAVSSFAATVGKITGSVIDKAIEYMVGQNVPPVAIASALLGGCMALLARTLPDDAIVGILNNAMASVRSGALRGNGQG